MKQKKQLKLSDLRVQSFLTLLEDNTDHVKGGKPFTILSNCINSCAVPCDYSIWEGGKIIC